MKIQIDIDGDLWTKFREKVFYCGKTLREVVPTVIEPALKTYLEPTPDCSCPTEIDEPQPTLEAIRQSWEQLDRITPPKPPRRCELCDMPADKVFASGSYKVCYKCWKSANSNGPSSEPSVSSSSS